MKKKYLIAVGLLLTLSVGLNVYLIVADHTPIVFDGVGVTDPVTWYSPSNLAFSGVPISLQDKKSNLREGYQLFSGEIRIDRQNPNTLECAVANTLVNKEAVTIDPPFKSHDRPCKIVQFDGAGQVAIVESNGITFSVRGTMATWQDHEGNGPLVTTFDRVFRNDKFK